MSTDPTSGSSTPSVQSYRTRVEAAARDLRERGGEVPSVGIVLHAGISAPAAFEAAVRWRPEGWPAGSGDDQDDRDGWAVGTLQGTRVVIDAGARALHDGATAREVTFSVRALAVAGVDTFLFANTATHVAPEKEAPALVLATDHVNFQGANPLVGPNVEEWGPRFPDMTTPYAPTLRETAHAVALREGIALREGVYLATLGPDRGTRAEHRMARRLGADVVGTDAVQKVIAARHMDRRVGLLSVATPPDDPAATHSAPPDARPALRSSLHTLLAGMAADVKSEQKSN